MDSCAHHWKARTSPLSPSMAIIRHQPWPMYVPSAMTVWRFASGGAMRAGLTSTMRSACAGRARRPWIPGPSGTTAPESMRRTPPASAPVCGRAAASSSSAGRSGISTVACLCRSVRSSSSHARIPGIFRFVGWLSHTIQPTTGSASFSTRGKRHADTRTRTRPDLDHKHHKSSYKPELKIE